MSQQQWGRSPYGRSPYGQAGWGSPFGAPQGRSPYGRPLAPQRRRRSPVGGVLLLLIVVGLIAFGGTSLGSSSSRSTSEGPYQNENYQVPPPDTSPPPLPVPQTYDEAEQILTSSPFYGQSVPIPVDCDAPPINVENASDSQLEQHFNGMMACLMRVWEPPVTNAGLVLVRPTVTIYGSQITTKCGTAEVNAFYCAGDQQVYYSNRLPDAVPIVRTDRWAADVVIAHEFGHALQARTAILVSAKALGQESNDESTDLLYSRRLETQADCFSGMFMGSVSQSLGVTASDRSSIEDTFAAVGDDTVSGRPNIVGNHGLARSRVRWGTAGLDSSDVGTCNTFTAPSSSVR